MQWNFSFSDRLNPFMLKIYLTNQIWSKHLTNNSAYLFLRLTFAISSTQILNVGLLIDSLKCACWIFARPSRLKCTTQPGSDQNGLITYGVPDHPGRKWLWAEWLVRAEGASDLQGLCTSGCKLMLQTSFGRKLGIHRLKNLKKRWHLL